MSRRTTMHCSPSPPLVAGLVLFASGEALMGPSLDAYISRTVRPAEHGRVQGGKQSVQALARLLGPIAGGQLYASAGRPTPARSGVTLVALAAAAVVHARSWGRPLGRERSEHSPGQVRTNLPLDNSARSE